MAIPLVAAAGAGLAKLGIGAKLAAALGKAKALVGMTGGAKATAGVGSAMKSAAGLPGVVASAPTRMAGTKLAEAAAVTPAFKSGVGKLIFGNMDKGMIATRLAPDLMFGGVAALTTPGDLIDKAVAGGAQAIGGGLGGLALGRATQRFGNTASTLADMAGSIGGDMAGMATGDSILRAKDSLLGGSGQTPFERMSAEQQEEFANQIRQQTLMGAGGLIPGFQQQYL